MHRCARVIVFEPSKRIIAAKGWGGRGAGKIPFSDTVLRYIRSGVGGVAKPWVPTLHGRALQPGRKGDKRRTEPFTHEGIPFRGLRLCDNCAPSAAPFWGVVLRIERPLFRSGQVKRAHRPVRLPGGPAAPPPSAFAPLPPLLLLVFCSGSGSGSLAGVLVCLSILPLLLPSLVRFTRVLAKMSLCVLS